MTMPGDVGEAHERAGKASQGSLALIHAASGVVLKKPSGGL